MAAPMTSNVTDLCRLCGTDTLSIVRHPIFEADGVSRRLANKITECLPVVVTEQDRLPKIMCGECVYKLDLLSEFRNNVVKTEHLLESLVDGVKPEIIENEEHDDDFGADDDFRSSSPELEQNEPEVLIKEEEALPVKRPRRAAAAAAAAAKKPGKRGRKRKQTEGVAEEAPTKAAKRSVDEEQLPEKPREPKKRGRKPKDHKESAGSRWKRWKEQQLNPVEPEPHPSGRPMRRSAKSAMRSISKFAKLAAKVDEELKAQPMGAGLPYKGDVDSEEEQMAHDLRPECCRYCKLYVGKERVEMSEHLKLRHPEKVTCPTCSEVFPSEFFLTRHLKQHTAEVVEKKRLHVPRLQIQRSNGRMARVYRCPDCDKLVSCIKRHRIVAHGNGEYPFACEECEYRFPVASDLRSHVRRKHRGEFASLCAECGKGFTCRSALEDHERKHRGERSFVCDACGRGFFSKVNLTSHLRTHEASLELECDLCGKCYPSATHLRSHRMMHFEENRRFACNFCPQKFFKRGILDYHIKLKHTLERPFECNTCGKTFIMRSQMEEHSRRHLGERSHDCMHCSKNYYKKRNLQRHILSAHKHLVETWLCDECPREYLKQRSLIDHKLQAHPTVAEMVRKKAEAAAAAEMLQKMPQQENEQEPRVVVEILPQPEAQNDLLPMEFKDLFAL